MPSPMQQEEEQAMPSPTPPGPKAMAPGLPAEISAELARAVARVLPPDIAVRVRDMALPQDVAILRWVSSAIPFTTDADVTRISRALLDANFDPGAHINTVVPCPLVSRGQSKTWIRVAVKGFQCGTEVSFDENGEETYNYQGIHATTTLGALGIIRDRALRGGGYGNSAYCRLVQEPQTQQVVVDLCIEPGVSANKNLSDVLFEVYARGPSMNTHRAVESGAADDRGGTYADMSLAERGIIAHYRSGKESRWLVPLPLLSIRAIWMCPSSFHDLDRALVAQQMR